MYGSKLQIGLHVEGTGSGLMQGNIERSPGGTE
jgi:hypothetical protein